MKKIIYLLTVIILTTTLFGCGNTLSSTTLEPNETEASISEEDFDKMLNGSTILESKQKLSIITTLFPQYDFARHIAGDKADVVLLLPPGADSHSFEPTIADIVEINEADLFIYTGKSMEGWTSKILDNVETPDLIVLDLSEGVTLLSGGDEHDHGDDDHDDHDDHDHQHNDPHIWTDPLIAIKMVKDIRDKLILMDPDNLAYYNENAESLITDLEELDSKIREIVENGNRKDLYFGGHFALLYFTEEYGLNAHYAYESHADGSEPSIGGMTEMIDNMKENNIPVIYYEELTEPKVARAISEETGAEMLLFHSCHNLSSDDFKAGLTYVDIMRQNAENLAKGLE